MNLLYNVQSVDNFDHFTLKNTISLLGSNSGKLTWAIRDKRIVWDAPDQGWSLDVSKNWREWDEKIVIDLKPNHATQVFLVELTDAYGFNHRDGWTALLYRLKILHKASDKTTFNKQQFSVDTNIKAEIIYTHAYALGYISNGQLIGKWSPPHGNTTGLLLGPEAYRFFNQKMNKDEGINV